VCDAQIAIRPLSGMSLFLVMVIIDLDNTNIPQVGEIRTYIFGPAANGTCVRQMRPDRGVNSSGHVSLVLISKSAPLFHS
jgi:hypothetical protein